MAQEIGINCTLKGAHCYLSACIESGVCKLGEQAVDRIINATSGPAADSTTTGGAKVPATVKAAPLCHSGLYRLGGVGKASIWCGRAAAVTDHIPGQPEQVALIVCLMGHDKYLQREEMGLVTGNAGARKLLPRSLFVSHAPTPVLTLDWEDFGVPELDTAWWVRLNDALAKIDGDVIFYCEGGHGRTGTAMSILAHMNGWCGRQDPVEWLRAVYCKSVVEAEKQIIYIEKITGFPVAAKPTFAGWMDYGNQHGVGWNATQSAPGKQKAFAFGGASKTMSIRKYKKWCRLQQKRGVNDIRRIDQLADVEMILVDGQWFLWTKADKSFKWQGTLAKDGT